MTKTITIDNDLSKKIQVAQFEMKSRQDLLAFMLNTGVSVTADSFKAYHDEYQRYYIEFEEIKNYLETNILKPAIPGTLINWNLDFDSCEVTCTYEEN